MPQPYGQSLSLVTDLYQLTMAAGYWREGLADREAVFHHYFREAPFGGAFAVAAGLANALEWLRELRFREDDIDYLLGLKGRAGDPLFQPEFLDYLAGIAFDCDVDAVPEGTVVFAHEPLLRVRGPLIQCQLAETALLNIVNFQTLVATKAARVCLAAGPDPVLEFGLRRAQGIDGGLSASRAAFIGGCAGTSNVLAGKLYDIPVKGTHAHSWVVAFDSESEAFEALARALPNDSVLLVDTYDTLEGVRRAAEVGRALHARGGHLAGIRLDSGDLAGLSIEARKILDAAGLPGTQIVASNDLDEHEILKLKDRGARIGVWGVGTSIASAKGQSALGGVYKLSLLRNGSGEWEGKAKRSEDPAKASLPGMLQVRRFFEGDRIGADLVFDERQPPKHPCTGVEFPSSSPGPGIELRGRHVDLLQPVLRKREPVGSRDTVAEAQERCRSQLSQLPAEFLGIRAERSFPVLLESGLRRLREKVLGDSGDGAPGAADPIPGRWRLA